MSYSQTHRIDFKTMFTYIHIQFIKVAHMETYDMCTYVKTCVYMHMHMYENVSMGAGIFTWMHHSTCK